MPNLTLTDNLSPAAAATTRGTLFLNQAQREVWSRAQRAAREHADSEAEARELMGRAALVAAEQLLARRAGGEV